MTTIAEKFDRLDARLAAVRDAIRNGVDKIAHEHIAAARADIDARRAAMSQQETELAAAVEALHRAYVRGCDEHAAGAPELYDMIEAGRLNLERLRERRRVWVERVEADLAAAIAAHATLGQPASAGGAA